VTVNGMVSEIKMAAYTIYVCEVVTSKSACHAVGQSPFQRVISNV